MKTKHTWGRDWIRITAPVLMIAGFTVLFLASGNGANGQTRSEDDVKQAKEAAPPPLVKNWFTQNSSRYARVVEQTGSTPVTTWPSAGLPWHGGGQSKPAY